MAHADPFRFLEIRGVLGHDERGDAPGPLGGGIGSRGHDEDFADAGVGDEDLRTVQDVMVALLHRHGARAPGVRPRAGLGQPEPPQNLPGGEERDVALFLLRRAEVHDRRRPQSGMGAHGDGVARVDLRELVDHHDVGEVVHAGSTQLLRPRNAEQAEVGHLSHVVPGELTRQVVAAGARLHDLLREVAYHVANLKVKVGEVEGVVHAEN